MVREQWRSILPEALATTRALGPRLAHLGDSYILPLLPEPEDRNDIADELYAEARALAPFTTQLVGQIPYLVAYAFSKLVAGRKIPLHEHWNPYLVAILCLQHGGASHISVGGERREFVDGEIVMFDYTLPHESKNDGTDDRYVMLMVVDPRKARAHLHSQVAL
jgi:aspartyl/asparaginyl beta-hydroxylase (cupin superfamily)